MYVVDVPSGVRARLREFAVAILVVLTAAALLAAADATPAQAQTQDDDSTQAAIESVAITSNPQNDNGTYGVGEEIEVTATFNRDVTVQDGAGYVTPYMLLRIGDETVAATYTGTDGAKVRFRYTVVEGNLDEDGVAIPQNALERGVGEVAEFGPAVGGADGSASIAVASEIRDALGRIADLSHDSVPNATAHKVDAVVPTISSVGIVSWVPERADGTYGYGVGDRVEIVAAMSRVVTVDGTPQIELDVGGVPRLADYYVPDDSAYGTALPDDLVPGAILAFRYTVAADDNDLDGVSIGADKITLNGGSVVDEVGNAADLAHDAVGAVSAHSVSTPPVVKSVAITSRARTHWQVLDVGDGTYGIGEQIEVTVTFDQDVTVTDGPGYHKPGLTLMIGSTPQHAEYIGSAGAEVRFGYRVMFGDLDEDGVAIPQNALSLGESPSEEAIASLAEMGIVAARAAAITDVHGTGAVVAHDAVPGSEFHKVDAVPATIKSVAIESSAGEDDTYVVDDTIKIVVTTSEVVIVSSADGKPALTIGLDVGGEQKQAEYVPGNPFDEEALREMVFEYTVAIGDSDADGVSVIANRIRVFGDSTIKDRFGNPYDLGYSAVEAGAEHKVAAPGGL